MLHALLLLVAAMKVSVWVTIVIVAYRKRRILPLIYGPLGAIATATRGLNDAGNTLPDWTAQAAAFVGTPIAFLILASLLVTEPTTPVGPRWRF